ncbi:MAG: LysM peptidoglycan-binding domain-containing protein, partial [Bacteroidota bacterium]
MNGLRKYLITLLFLVFLSYTASAQQFVTHAVKEGETLESIAKHYRVTPYNILKFNKELKQGDKLLPNTILVIPAGIGKQEPSSRVVMDQKKLYGEEEAVEQQPPVGFRSHKVKKRETLYGIAKRYNVTEQDIKRYNKELYSNQLRKRMVLRIPRYLNVSKERDSILATDFEVYTVAPKETRWSIAHKYGITIDSLVGLNPDLSRLSDYLRAGQQLRLPKLPGSSLENQETQLFSSYTVPPKMNFYRLEKEFGIPSEEIVRLNPEIAQLGGLKEGMVIRIPEKKLDPGAINTDNFIFYEVKPKQTVFSLTRKLGISYDDLLLLNPDLKQGLKAGMVLKLPNDQEGDFEVRNALVLDKINLLDSIDVVHRPKIMFVLPFRLDRLNLKDKESVETNIENRNDIKYSLGLYSGALIALDSIAKLGVSVDVVTHDNHLDLARTKEILFRESLSDVDAVIGPLDELSLKEVAVRASAQGTPVIAPVPVKSDISLNNVFFSYTSDAVLRKRMLEQVARNRNDQNIVVIADQKNAAVRDSILGKFPDAQVVAVLEEEKNIGVNRDKLASVMSM